DYQPFNEISLVINVRAVRITLFTPMMSYGYSADIRVHPARLPTWDELVSADFLTDNAVALLTAMVRSSQGCVVIGAGKSGKTMLISMLAQLLPDPQGAVAVERAGELSLPEGVRRLTARWPSGDVPGITFGEQIGVALAQQPTCIILDEVRSDEPA